MIEQIAYMALLSAPELASGTASLASGASSFAGTLVERVGSRFAAGVYDGFREKVSGDASRLGNTLLGALGRPMTSFTEGLSETASQVFSSALKEEGVTLADADELRILRKLAADVSDGRDPGPVLQDLKRFYAEQTANAKK